MNIIGLKDIDIFDVGNKLQLYGAIYSDGHQAYLIPLPDESLDDLNCQHVLRLDASNMEAFLAQTDVLDVKAGKAILRKSQRQIDQVMSWKVFARDGYRCRYCGRGNLPLTVDHVDLWENGGATVEQNLISACRKCNKLRGNMEYNAWLGSADYMAVGKNLGPDGHLQNILVLSQLDTLKKLRRPVRSR